MCCHRPLASQSVVQITSVNRTQHIMPMESERMAEDHKRKELSAHGFSLVNSKHYEETFSNFVLRSPPAAASS